MLSPVQYIENQGDFGGEKWLVFESFSDQPSFMPTALAGEYPFGEHSLVGACVTIVAVTSSDGRDWAAYMAAHILGVDSADRETRARWSRTRRRGNKLPKNVAEAMFPRAVEEWGRYRL
jgi:hypothetical protein